MRALQPQADVAGTDGPSEQSPEDAADAVGDVGDSPHTHDRQHDAEEEPADHQLDGLAIDGIAETGVAAAEHPEQAKQPIDDAREPDAAMKEGLFGRVRAGGEQGIHAERAAVAELVLDLRAEHPEPVQVKHQVQDVRGGTGRA